VYCEVTVAVVSTISHEHAFAKPDSAWMRCGFLVDVGSNIVPLARAELIISLTSEGAMAIMLAPRAASEGSAALKIVVAVWVIVRVVAVRVVEVTVVVDSALVVRVL